MLTWLNHLRKAGVNLYSFLFESLLDMFNLVLKERSHGLFHCNPYLDLPSLRILFEEFKFNRSLFGKFEIGAKEFLFILYLTALFLGQTKQSRKIRENAIHLSNVAI